MVARFQTLFSIVSFAGKSDAEKQQYWLYLSMQKQRNQVGSVLSGSDWRKHRRNGNGSHVPTKIRQLVSDLQKAGFYLPPGGRGSHRNFTIRSFLARISLAAMTLTMAHHYQEKQIRNAIREANK